METTKTIGGALTVKKSDELNTAALTASAVQELQATIAVVLQFPRDERKAWEGLLATCQRPAFAEKATYKFPRGNADVTGPSVNLAREAARVWGNIRYGVDILRDDEHSVHLRGWAWDAQTNNKTSLDASFRKLIYRKKGGWVKPDERDLRELINRHGAFLERNCLLKLLPLDFGPSQGL